MARALQQSGVQTEVAGAVRAAVELCAARARIQRKYLQELEEGVRGRQTCVRLPLLPAEVRGARNLRPSRSGSRGWTRGSAARARTAKRMAPTA